MALENGLIANKDKLYTIESNLTSTMERLLKPIQQRLNYHLPLPSDSQSLGLWHTNSEDEPAESCNAIFANDTNAPSGYYWIKVSSGSPIRVYCKMQDATCDNLTGGWMRVAYFDMRRPSHQCPSGLTLTTRSSGPRRLCDVTSASRTSCPSNTYTVHGVRYSHVYGKIIAYQNDRPLAFYYNDYHGIDQAYVFGVSLTLGLNPQKHIWTFAEAIDETAYNNPSFRCLCINTNLNKQSMTIPNFVGNDYFCDTIKPQQSI